MPPLIPDVCPRNEVFNLTTKLVQTKDNPNGSKEWVVQDAFIEQFKAKGYSVSLSGLKETKLYVTNIS